MGNTLTSASGILEFPSVQEAINASAVDHMDKGRLCGEAKDAVQKAWQRANISMENPTDEELCDIAVRAVVNAGPCPPQCSRCEYHKSKGNKTPGKLIPGHSGKCTYPTGLCAHITTQAYEDQPVASTSTRTLPASVQDFVETNFQGPVRSAKAQAALDTYACLWADERGDMFPEELASDVCQALLLGGEDMAVKLALAVRDCIDREDATWGGRSEESSPDAASASDTPIIPEISEERGAELAQVQNTASAIDQAVMDAEDVFRDLGRLEGISFMATVADVAAAQIFEKIKQNKAYKDLPYIDETGNRRRIADLEEFCQIKLGKSARRVRELSGNLRLLGPDLYESAERIGFRAKDYRALKALPAEEQEVVKTAIESESKDEVLDILQDMAARHQAEREAAKKREEDLTADYDARGKLLADKGEQLERTKEDLYRLKSLPKDADLELKLAREEEAVERLHREHVTFLASSKTFLQAVSEILGDGDVSAHTKEHAVFEVRQVAEAFNQFLLDCSIPVDFAEIVYPDWMRGSAQDDLEAGNTEEPNGAHGSW